MRDTVTGECIRLDKYIEEFCDTQAAAKDATPTRKEEMAALRVRAATLDKEQLGAVINTYNLKSPKGNPLSAPFDFNLMFASSIGPEGTKKGYMRPELAQGIILNFKRLVDSNNAPRMPFAAACIGQAFRNEIAPRASLLRVREFTLAEIEHFVNPNNKKHAKFDRVRDTVIWAWCREDQLAGRPPSQITIGAAVAQKMIDNETLGYFVARTALFLKSVGIRHLRFRQHCKGEMAHYAQDCWDAECLTSYGWTECVGLADRSAYDLTHHSKASGKELCAREEYDPPRIVRVLDRKINKSAFGKAFGKDNGVVTKAVMDLPEEEAQRIDAELKAGKSAVVKAEDGREFTLQPGMVTFAPKDEKQTGRNYVPNVIEPSFGVGRVLYAVLEQSYWVRRDDTGKNEKRAVFSFSPSVAPQKVAILPLMVKESLEPTMTKLRDELVARGLSNRSDDSGTSIGRKYARIDELGIPFGITCDFEDDGRVTLRERDTAKQVRIPIAEVADVVASLCRTTNARSWDDVFHSYPEQEQKA